MKLAKVARAARRILGIFQSVFEMEFPRIKSSVMALFRNTLIYAHRGQKKERGEFSLSNQAPFLFFFYFLHHSKRIKLPLPAASTYEFKFDQTRVRKHRHSRKFSYERAGNGIKAV